MHKIKQINLDNRRSVLLMAVTVLLSAVAIVKKAMAMEKPIAAQNSAVLILNQAGATRGKRFGIEADLASAVKDGTCSGIGVVQDGNLVTSGTCPFMAMQLGKPDGTPEPTRKFDTLLK